MATAASRHCATGDIAQAIADVMGERGLEVDADIASVVIAQGVAVEIA